MAIENITGDLVGARSTFPKKAGQFIEVSGARVHNLKNIDVKIPMYWSYLKYRSVPSTSIKP